MMDFASLVLTDSIKVLLRDTATRLRGTERQQFMAQVIESLGCGGAIQVERELGRNRGTVRKGLFELKHGPIQDALWSFVDYKGNKQFSYISQQVY